MSIDLPPLGFGAAQLGNLYRSTTEEEARGAVDAAWESGLRYFDTAPHYGLGLSEHRLGRALADRPRGEYLLSTKVGRLLREGPGDGDDLDHGFAVPDDRRRVWDVSADGVRRSLEESLVRLGLDRIDIAYLHDPEEGPEDRAITEALPALESLRAEGIIGRIGVGSKSVAVIERAIAAADLDVVMLSGRYTLLEQPAAATLLPLCADRDVEVVAVSVFNSGILARSEPPDDARYEYGQAPQALLARARRIAALASAYDVELPDLAIQFPLRHPAIRSVVLGMRTARQVRDNVARAQVTVPEELWSEIDALNASVDALSGTHP